jgi:hypothetical protein
MTGAELITMSIIYIVYTLSVFLVGVFFGAVFTVAHVHNRFNKIHDEMARKLLAPPPITKGDEWKDKSKEDEQWLRDQLDGNDNKDKEKE